MPAGQVDIASPNAASEAKSSPGGLIGITASFATSQLAALAAFFGAIGAAYLSFQKLESGLGLSMPQCAVLVAALLALLFFSHTLPTLLEKRRKARLAQITGSTRPGYFQLSPREDEESFQRADGKHDEVLKWLRQPPSRVLYLTGSSGTGKSSLLAAWALPKLEREGVKVIRLRGYQDPAQALEGELKRPGAIWKRNPPETTDLNALFEEARQRIQPARILVVFDQFEEFLILQEEKQRVRFVEFLTAQSALREPGSTILLVFRAEYDGFIQDLNLPTPIPGKNLQKVSAFTQRAAQEFLAGSGLKIEQQLLTGVLREAAEVEETKGLIRPVTLNLCGLVLARFATGLPHAFRPGRLIRGFVHEAVFQSEVRDASPILLPKLISPQVTKRPLTIGELANGTNLSARQAQGVMFKLGDPERGIVHALDSEYAVWEISHDFLVPMIDSMLARWRVSLSKRVRPWLPLGYVAVMLAALFVAPFLRPDPIAELNRLHWTTRNLDASNATDELFIRDGIEYVFTFDSYPPPESAGVLRRVPARFEVVLERIDSFDTAHFGAWAGLTNLRILDLSQDSGLEDISAAKGLPRVTEIDFSVFHSFADADLSNLPQSLSTLDLGLVTVTDAGLKNLPKSLTALKVDGARQITDAGLKDLPKSLTSLYLDNDPRITGAGFKDLPRSLASLSLYGDTGITDAGLKDLPESLTELELSNDPEITDAGLKGLPKSMITLNLSRDPQITDAGLKDLPRSLTSLNLADDSKVTDAGLKVLPATVQVSR